MFINCDWEEELTYCAWKLCQIVRKKTGEIGIATSEGTKKENEREEIFIRSKYSLSRSRFFIFRSLTPSLSCILIRQPWYTNPVPGKKMLWSCIPTISHLSLHCSQATPKEPSDEFYRRLSLALSSFSPDTPILTCFAAKRYCTMFYTLPLIHPMRKRACSREFQRWRYMGHAFLHFSDF